MPLRPVGEAVELVVDLKDRVKLRHLEPPDPGGRGAAYNRKANKFPDFGRKRGPKPKMRGVFGAPGVGLQRPADGTGSGGSGTPVTGNVSSTDRMVAELKGNPACRRN